MENDERASLIKNNYDNSVAYSRDDGSSCGNSINSNIDINPYNKNDDSGSSNSSSSSITENENYTLIKPSSITSSPVYKPQNYQNNHNYNQPQHHQQQKDQEQLQEQEQEQKPNVFQRIWDLFFSLSNDTNTDNVSSENDYHNNRSGEINNYNNNNGNNNSINNNNDKRSRSNSCIGYVDENQKYIIQQNNISNNNNESSSSSKSREENNIIINNNKININNDDQQDKKEQDESNRIYDLFFSLSITCGEDEEVNNNKNVNKTNKSNNRIKYNELKIDDKQEQHDKNDNKNSQQSTENIIQPQQEEKRQQKQQQEQQIEQQKGQEQQEQQEQKQQEQQIIQQTTPKFKKEDPKNLFEKSPFFEPVRPVIDFSDPILLEPIESKLPGNLEKNKYLYENIKPSPIPLSVLLNGLTVCDLEGNQILMTNLYKKKRVVVAIFRRFGCLICRLQALDLSSLKPKLDKLGIELIGIGFDEDGLEEFMQLNFFAGKIYLDKTRSIYRALNLKRRSKLTTYELFLDPRVMVYYRRLKELGLSANYRKDGFQLGATMVLGPQPHEAHYDFRPQRYADIFDLKEIWEACQKPYPSESEVLAARKIDISVPKPVTLNCDNNLKFDLSVYNGKSKSITTTASKNQVDKEYDKDEYDEDEEYTKDNDDSIYSDDGQYDNDGDYDDDDDDYNQYEDDEQYDDELEGVKLPKPSKSSKILSTILDSIQVDPSLFKTEGIQIYTVPSLEIVPESNDFEQISASGTSGPSGTISQEQKYFDKLNNSNYVNKSFYKVSKSSKFILKEDDEFENPLIYCPYKYNGD